MKEEVQSEVQVEELRGPVVPCGTAVPHRSTLDLYGLSGLARLS